jgi:hypothetical protein
MLGTVVIGFPFRVWAPLVTLVLCIDLEDKGGSIFLLLF